MEQETQVLLENTAEFNEIRDGAPVAEENDVKDKKNYKIVWVSFILSILVVLEHSINYSIYNSSGFWYLVQKFIEQITDIAVPTFFVLSGFLFFKDLDQKSIKRKLISRIFSLVIPYLIWNFVDFLFYFALTNISFTANLMNMERIEFTFLNVLKCFYSNEYSVMHFVRNLIVYVVVSILFYHVIKIKYIGWLPALISFALCTVFRLELFNYFCLFLVGAYLGKCFPNFLLQYKFKKYLIAIFFGLFITINVVSTLLSCLKIYLANYFYFPITLIEVFAFWFCLDFITFKKPKYWWVGISFFIYCTHSIILESLEKIYLLLFGKSVLASVTCFFLVPLITLGIVVLFAYLLRRFVKPVWKILSGGRG